MLFAISQVYLLFTHKVKPYDIFQNPVATEAKKFTREELLADPSLAIQMQSDIMSNILKQEMGKSLNFGASLFFMYFVMTFGFRLSSLGVQLVRPIKVAMRAKSVEVNNDATERMNSS